MSKFINLVNQKFGYLTVIERDFEKQGNTKKVYWKCKCDCSPDKIVSVRMDALRSGVTISCGCYHKNIASKKSKNKKYNDYLVYGDITFVFTSNNNIILIDTEDFHLIKDYCWNITLNEYAQARDCSNGSLVLMHRIITNAPNDKIVDHKNHNTLDNRKNNLRVCDYENNNANQLLSKNNTSGYKGVYWDKEKNKWEVKIGFKSKNLHIGYYENIKDAIKSRLQAEIKYFGEFRCIIKDVNNE